jgi:dTDP-4-amino-4,6-dideoxygalactose transaminase
MLRDHGQSKKYHHEIEGYNSRLDAIQAGILQVKLRHLPLWTEQRRAIASRYRDGLEYVAHAVGIPDEPTWVRPVYHLYVVRVADRPEFMRHLASENIGTGIHYPIPLHLQKAYAHMGFRNGQFPVSEKLANEIVSLPMYPQLAAERQVEVVEQVLAFVAARDPIYNGMVPLAMAAAQ